MARFTPINQQLSERPIYHANGGQILGLHRVCVDNILFDPKWCQAQFGNKWMFSISSSHTNIYVNSSEQALLVKLRFGEHK